MATSYFEKSSHHFSRNLKFENGSNPLNELSELFEDSLHNGSQWFEWIITLNDMQDCCCLKVRVASFSRYNKTILIENLRLSPSMKSGLEPEWVQQFLCRFPTRYTTVAEIVFNCPKELLDQVQFDVTFRRASPAPKGRCSCRPRLESTPRATAMHALLSADLAKQFGDEATSDVTFIVGDRLFPAHKWILQARVPYFKNMFSSQMLETKTSKVRVKDADSDTFRHMLRFVYCGELPSDMDSVAEHLLPLADKYGIEQLKVACEASLRRSLDRINAIVTLLVAEFYGCPKLKETCIEKLSDWKEVMDASEFGPLKDYPELLIAILTHKKQPSSANAVADAEGDGEESNDDSESVDEDMANEDSGTESVHAPIANGDDDDSDAESVHAPMGEDDSDADSVQALVPSPDSDDESEDAEEENSASEADSDNDSDADDDGEE